MWTRPTLITALAVVVASGVAVPLAATRGTFDGHDLPDVVVAWLLIAVVVGSWLLATLRPGRTYRRADLLTLIVMATVFAALFVWSQLRPHVIAPPIDEWGIACGLVGMGFVVVALARGTGSRGWADGPGAVAVAGTVLATLLMCCVPGMKDLSDEPEDYDLPVALLDSEGHAYEVRPLPAGATLISTSCYGMHSKCVQQYAFAATDGASRSQLIDRLVAHYRDLGWPLTLDGKRYSGCRTVAGILTWRDHCMFLITGPSDRETPYAKDVPGAVSVYMG
jgi:hypothetical protein